MIITGTPKDRLAQLRDELEAIDVNMRELSIFGREYRNYVERRARTARQIAMLEEGERK